MRHDPPSSGSQVLSVRVTASERDLLAQAAERGRTNLSDFVRRKALEAAEVELLDRRVVSIPAADWAKFEAWATRPARDIPALRQLAEHKAEWRD